MVPMRPGTIYSNLRYARKSAMFLSNQTAILLRFKSFTPSADPRGQPQRVDIRMPITGHFYAITPKDVLDSNGFYAVGDITSSTEVKITGVNNTAGSLAQADRLIYDGFTYQVIGKPFRKIAGGGRIYTITVWRKT